MRLAFVCRRQQELLQLVFLTYWDHASQLAEYIDKSIISATAPTFKTTSPGVKRFDHAP
jgi:hypothetical protein